MSFPQLCKNQCVRAIYSCSLVRNYSLSRDVRVEEAELPPNSLYHFFKEDGAENPDAEGSAWRKFYAGLETISAPMFSCDIFEESENGELYFKGILYIIGFDTPDDGVIFRFKYL